MFDEPTVGTRRCTTMSSMTAFSSFSDSVRVHGILAKKEKRVRCQILGKNPGLMIRVSVFRRHVNVGGNN